MFRNRWINLAIIAFIIYAVISEQQKKQPPTSANIKSDNAISSSSNLSEVKLGNPTISAHAAKETSFIGKQVAKFINNTISTPEGQEAMKKVISATGMADNIKIPKEFQEMNITDEKIGSGEEVTCGEDVEIRYFTYSLDNKKIIDQSVTTKVNIGSATHHRGLELGIIGMKPGGVRKIIMSPYLTNKHPNFFKADINPDEYTIIIVELIKSSPLPNSKSMRVFEQSKGKGELAICGDTVKIDYTISDINGNVLHDSKLVNNLPVTVKIGDLNTPYALTGALLYMNQGGARTVLAIPQMYNNTQGTKTSFIPTSVKLPFNEITILDVKMP